MNSRFCDMLDLGPFSSSGTKSGCDLTAVEAGGCGIPRPHTPGVKTRDGSRKMDRGYVVRDGEETYNREGSSHDDSDL
jgi:hypothetical protein